MVASPSNTRYLPTFSYPAATKGNRAYAPLHGLGDAAPDEGGAYSPTAVRGQYAHHVHLQLPRFPQGRLHTGAKAYGLIAHKGQIDIVLGTLENGDDLARRIGAVSQTFVLHREERLCILDYGFCSANAIALAHKPIMVCSFPRQLDARRAAPI